MMDVVPGLIQKIEKDFDQFAYGSLELKSALLELKNKQATYANANIFAIEIGQLLSRSLMENISSSVLPDGKMYFNIANRILMPTLMKNHEIITGYASDVQRLLNTSAGIDIKAQTSEFNTDRVKGLVNRLSSESSFDDVKWLLNEPIVNFSQSIVDDVIQSNVKFHAEAGLSPKIAREAEGKACKWCKALAGSYNYGEEPKDIYRRHENCRCLVEYDPGNGKKQSVWSKLWKNRQKEEEREYRKNLNLKDKRTLDVMAVKRHMNAINLKTASPHDLIGLGKKVNDLYGIDKLIGNKEKLTEIFNNFRPMSGKIPDRLWYNRSNKVIRSQIEKAFSYYPKDWANLLEKNNQNIFAGKRNRGFFINELVNSSRTKILKGAKLGDGVSIYSDGIRKATAYHEIGHLVEHFNQDLLRVSKEFVSYRTKGEEFSRLRDVLPGYKYDYREVTKKDNFISPYIGKEYTNGSEVLSMGLESIYEPGSGQLYRISSDGKKYFKLINQDPEFLNLIIGMILKG